MARTRNRLVPNFRKLKFIPIDDCDRRIRTNCPQSDRLSLFKQHPALFGFHEREGLGTCVFYKGPVHSVQPSSAAASNSAPAQEDSYREARREFGRIAAAFYREVAGRLAVASPLSLAELSRCLPLPPEFRGAYAQALRSDRQQRFVVDGNLVFPSEAAAVDPRPSHWRSGPLGPDPVGTPYAAAGAGRNRDGMSSSNDDTGPGIDPMHWASRGANAYVSSHSHASSPRASENGGHAATASGNEAGPEFRHVAFGKLADAFCSAVVVQLALANGPQTIDELRRCVPMPLEIKGTYVDALKQDRKARFTIIDDIVFLAAAVPELNNWRQPVTGTRSSRSIGIAASPQPKRATDAVSSIHSTSISQSAAASNVATSLHASSNGQEATTPNIAGDDHAALPHNERSEVETKAHWLDKVAEALDGLQQPHLVQHLSRIVPKPPFVHRYADALGEDGRFALVPFGRTAGDPLLAPDAYVVLKWRGTGSRPDPIPAHASADDPATAGSTQPAQGTERGVLTKAAAPTDDDSQATHAQGDALRTRFNAISSVWDDDDNANDSPTPMSADHGAPDGGSFGYDDDDGDYDDDDDLSDLLNLLPMETGGAAMHAESASDDESAGSRGGSAARAGRDDVNDESRIGSAQRAGTSATGGIPRSAMLEGNEPDASSIASNYTTTAGESVHSSQQHTASTATMLDAECGLDDELAPDALPHPATQEHGADSCGYTAEPPSQQRIDQLRVIARSFCDTVASFVEKHFRWAKTSSMLVKLGQHLKKPPEFASVPFTTLLLEDEQQRFVVFTSDPKEKGKHVFIVPESRWRPISDATPVPAVVLDIAGKEAAARREAAALQAAGGDGAFQQVTLVYDRPVLEWLDRITEFIKQKRAQCLLSLLLLRLPKPLGTRGTYRQLLELDPRRRFYFQSPSGVGRQAQWISLHPPESWAKQPDIDATGPVRVSITRLAGVNVRFIPASVSKRCDHPAVCNKLALGLCDRGHTMAEAQENDRRRMRGQVPPIPAEAKLAWTRAFELAWERVKGDSLPEEVFRGSAWSSGAAGAQSQPGGTAGADAAASSVRDVQHKSFMIAYDRRVLDWLAEVSAFLSRPIEQSVTFLMLTQAVPRPATIRGSYRHLLEHDPCCRFDVGDDADLHPNLQTVTLRPTKQWKPEPPVHQRPFVVTINPSASLPSSGEVGEQTSAINPNPSSSPTPTSA